MFMCICQMKKGTLLLCVVLLIAIWTGAQVCAFFAQKHKRPLVNHKIDFSEKQAIKEDSMRAITAQALTMSQGQQREHHEAIVNPPEITRLQTLMDEFEANPDGRWEHLIAIGNVYHKGAFPRFRPNVRMALDIYRVTSSCPDQVTADLALAKYIEARTDDMNSDDVAGDSLPVEFGERVCEVAAQAFMRSRLNRQKKPKAPPVIVPEPPVAEAVLFDFDTIWNNIQTVSANPRSDSQNVHDHSVTKTIKHNIHKLRSNCGANDNESTLESVRHSVLEQPNLSDDEKYQALQVIDNLSDKQHSSYDVSEKDVLSLVWSKIRGNSETKDDMAEILARQLASGIEYGTVVCSSGKIARMMGTFDGIDAAELEPSRPLWAVKEEMANVASSIRERHLQKMSSDQISEYEKGDSSSDHIVQAMKQDFQNKVKTDYVDKLGMNADIIDKMMGTYMEAF